MAPGVCGGRERKGDPSVGPPEFEPIDAHRQECRKFGAIRRHVLLLVRREVREQLKGAVEIGGMQQCARRLAGDLWRRRDRAQDSLAPTPDRGDRTKRRSIVQADRRGKRIVRFRGNVGITGGDLQGPCVARQAIFDQPSGRMGAPGIFAQTFAAHDGESAIRGVDA